MYMVWIVHVNVYGCTNILMCMVGTVHLNVYGVYKHINVYGVDCTY